MEHTTIKMCLISNQILINNIFFVNIITTPNKQLIKMLPITQVWKHNLEAEMSRLDRALLKYKVMSIDTEFPSSIRDTPRDGSEAKRYKDLKFNVDVLK
jgi:hypothetical protein